jgi:hypothetical protein
MGKIYVNQKLILNFTDTNGVDMSLQNIRVDYWAPSNQTDTPTGTVVSGQISTSSGSPIVTITVLKDILSVPSDGNRLWRFQIINITTGITWTVMCFAVSNKGTC